MPFSSSFRIVNKSPLHSLFSATSCVFAGDVLFKVPLAPACCSGAPSSVSSTNRLQGVEGHSFARSASLEKHKLVALGNEFNEFIVMKQQ